MSNVSTVGIVPEDQLNPEAIMPLSTSSGGEASCIGCRSDHVFKMQSDEGNDETEPWLLSLQKKELIKKRNGTWAVSQSDTFVLQAWAPLRVLLQ